MTQKALIEGKSLDFDIVLFNLFSIAQAVMKKWMQNPSDKILFA